MLTQTGLVRTGPLWLAGAEEQTADKLTATLSISLPSIFWRSCCHTQRCCLSPTAERLLWIEHSMSPWCDTYMPIHAHSHTRIVPTCVEDRKKIICLTNECFLERLVRKTSWFSHRWLEIEAIILNCHYRNWLNLLYFVYGVFVVTL